MTVWRSSMRKALILVTACLSLIRLSSAQNHSNLSAQELWQYGRGVIYDFDWREQGLVFPAEGRTGQGELSSG